MDPTRETPTRPLHFSQLCSRPVRLLLAHPIPIRPHAHRLGPRVWRHRPFIRRPRSTPKSSLPCRHAPQRLCQRANQASHHSERPLGLPSSKLGSLSPAAFRKRPRSIQDPGCCRTTCRTMNSLVPEFNRRIPMNVVSPPASSHQPWAPIVLLSH